jgi:LacI family transcriptional regulator, galactose operon repressor
MAERQVTIADVAAAAGVSVATVSKVINDRYGVAEQTSARVRAVIDKLGYTSSLVAQSMRSRRSNVIGVLAADIEPFNAELLKGAAQAIRGTGYDLVVFSDCGRHEDQAGWEQRALGRVSALTDGTILVTPSSVDVTVSGPLVAVDHNVRSSTLPTVDSDNFAGAVTATRYLIGLGHRRIGFLAGRPDLESARLREQGYRHALQRAGIDFDPQLVRVGGYHAATAREAAWQLLDLASPPTAVFGANDISAIETIAVARSMGLEVPEDVSVVGFDNVPESALCEPTLTTIDQSIQQMGYEAVRMLIGLIDDPAREPEQVVLPTRLVERSSCHRLAERA